MIRIMRTVKRSPIGLLGERLRPDMNLWVPIREGVQRLMTARVGFKRIDPSQRADRDRHRFRGIADAGPHIDRHLTRLEIPGDPPAGITFRQPHAGTRVRARNGPSGWSTSMSW